MQDDNESPDNIATKDTDEDSPPKKMTKVDGDSPPKKKTKIDDFFKGVTQKKDDTGNTSGYVREGK